MELVYQDPRNFANSIEAFSHPTHVFDSSSFSGSAGFDRLMSGGSSSRAKSSKMSSALMAKDQEKKKDAFSNNAHGQDIGTELNPQMPAPSTAKRVQAQLNRSN